MKKEWVEPEILVQQFVANEYVAACGESGVVSTSVLRMKNHGDIQKLSLDVAVFAGRPDEPQNIFRRGKLVRRIVQMQTLPVKMRTLGLIGVGQQGRKI